MKIEKISFAVLALFLTFSLVRAEDVEVDVSAIENMSYEQLIELALQNNPALKSSQEGLPMYAARVQEAQSAKKWNLSYQTSVTYNGLVPKSQGFTIPLVPTPVEFPESPIYAHDIYDIKFQLQKPLYTGGKLESVIRQTAVQKKIQYAEHEKTRHLVIYQVKEAYFSVLKSYEMLKVAIEKVIQLEAHLKTTQNKFKSGVATKFETLTAEVKLVQAKQSAETLESQLKIFKEALNRALGLELTYEQIDKYVEVIEATRKKQVKIEKTLAELLSLAKENRPEIRSVMLTEEASKAGLDVAKTNDNMSLSLFSETGWKRGNTLPEKFQFSFTAGVTFIYPIYDGGQTRAKVKQSRASIKQSAENLESFNQLVEFEVKQSLIDVQISRQKLNTLSKVIEQAKEAFRLARVQYEAGTVTHLDVLDAEISLTEAKNSVTQAQVDYDLSVAKLEKACGVVSF